MIETEEEKLEDSPIRSIAKAVVNTSVKFIITTTIATIVPAESKTQKVKLIVGSYAIGAMVAENASARVDKQIDSLIETVDAIKNFKTNMKIGETPVE